MTPPWTLPTRTVLPLGVTALLAAPHLDPTRLAWINELLAHRALTTSLVQGATVSVLALVTSVGQVLDNIRNWIIGILGGLATLFLTIGAARYLMAGGDGNPIGRAGWAVAGWRRGNHGLVTGADTAPGPGVRRRSRRSRGTCPHFLAE